MRKFHDSYLLLNKVRAIDWWLSVRTTTSGQFFFVLHLWNKNLQNQTKPLYCAKDQCEKKIRMICYIKHVIIKQKYGYYIRKVNNALIP